MKLAVSNIAWAPSRRGLAYEVLAKHGIRGLEIAPRLFLSQSRDPFAPTKEERRRALDEASLAGLQLVSMQALLFGVEGAALFGDSVAQQVFRNGMLRAIELAGQLGIPNLVFGSPRQRCIPDEMPASRALHYAAVLFQELGAAAVTEGCVIAIEANPGVYGTNFLTEFECARSFVEKVSHPGVRLVLDVGAMKLTGEWDNVEAAVARAASFLSHVHVSEPWLRPAPVHTMQTARLFQALSDASFTGWISIEMKGGETDEEIATLDAAVATLVAAAEAAGAVSAASS